jgi:hypothetical protein
VRYSSSPPDLAIAFTSSSNQTESVAIRASTFARQVLEEIRANLSVRTFSTHPLRLAIIRTAEAAKNCVERFGTACTTFTQVSANLTELERLIAPVYARISEKSSVVEALKNLYDAIDLCRNAARSWWPVAKPWLDRRLITALEQLVEQIKEWTAASVARIQTEYPALGWTVTSRDFRARAVKLFDAYWRIDGIEKPLKRVRRERVGDEGDDTPEMDDEEARLYFAGQPWADPLRDADDENVNDREVEIAQKLYKELGLEEAIISMKEVIAEKT